MATPFKLPKEYLWFVSNEGNIPPWILTDETTRLLCKQSIQSQYPGWDDVYPFAFSNEDVAIFCEGASGPTVKVLHLGTTPGSEVDSEFSNFTDWFLFAAKSTAEMMRLDLGDWNPN